MIILLAASAAKSFVKKCVVHGLPAVQTGRVHPHCFAWEEPADRQRFKPSLCEPFLLPVDRNAVLVRQVIKGGNRNDLIGFRMQEE